MNKRPYIIVSGRYSEKSAGIRAMHLICDAMNKMGFNAYIYLHPNYPVGRINSYPYVCPIVNNKLIDYLNAKRISPIYIYPENLKGHPFGGSTRIRYYLYFPGVWGGNKSEDDQMHISFSLAIAEKVKNKTYHLMPPLIDTKLFNSQHEHQERSCICYYAEKYELDGGHVDEKIRENGIKITRHGVPLMDQKFIYSIYKKSKFFYVYENTGLIIEALLSGVIVVIMPESKLSKMDIIYGPEIEWSGIAFGTHQDELQRAENTLCKVGKYYTSIENNFCKDLEKVCIDSQKIEYKFEEIPSIKYEAYINILDLLYLPLSLISAFKYSGLNYVKSFFKRKIIHFLNLIKR